MWTRRLCRPSRTQTGGSILPRHRHRFAGEDLRADQPARDNRADRGEVRALPGAVFLGADSGAGRPRLGLPWSTPDFGDCHELRPSAVVAGRRRGLLRAALAVAALRCAPAGRIAGAIRLRAPARAAHAVGLARQDAARKRGLLLGGTCPAVRGAGRARWPDIAGNRSRRRGNDIIFAIDTSRSMLTPDVQARSSYARQARHLRLRDATGRRRRGADRLRGQCVSGKPHSRSTTAHFTSHSTQSIPISFRAVAPISPAPFARRRARCGSRPGSDQILVLVTDGEDLDGNALTAATAAAQQDGLKIYTVGVGSAAWRSDSAAAGPGRRIREGRRRHLVKSRLDESGVEGHRRGHRRALRAARSAKARVSRPSTRQALAPLAKHDLASRQQKIYTQRYQWPLAAALALLLASVLMRHPPACPQRQGGRRPGHR